jgi:hypothetical protein
MIWDAILYHIPWWVQLTILSIPVVLGLILVGNLIGWSRVRPWIIPALGVLAAFGMLGRDRQQGYGDRVDQEHKAEAGAQEIVRKEHAEARRDTDADLDAKVDKWTKHS